MKALQEQPATLPISLEYSIFELVETKQNKMLPPINKFKTKEDIVNYLNVHGYFWDLCNKADENVSDDYLIFKALLFLEFEDMQQLFDIYEKERCHKIWEEQIENAGDYYDVISPMLKAFFFNEPKQSDNATNK